jgi:hypothetical protein
MDAFSTVEPSQPRRLCSNDSLWAELTVTGRGNFIAHQTRIDLHCLWMQRLDDSLPPSCM